jgi:hypothetical protein
MYEIPAEMFMDLSVGTQNISEIQRQFDMMEISQ